jgi:hypothetical protein
MTQRLPTCLLRRPYLADLEWAQSADEVRGPDPLELAGRPDPHLSAEVLTSLVGCAEFLRVDAFITFALPSAPAWNPGAHDGDGRLSGLDVRLSLPERIPNARSVALVRRR